MEEVIYLSEMNCVSGLRVQFKIETGEDERLIDSFNAFLNINDHGNLKKGLSENDFWKRLNLESVVTSTRDISLCFTVYSEEESNTAVQKRGELIDILEKLAESCPSCRQCGVRFLAAEIAETRDTKHFHRSQTYPTER